MEQSEKFDSWGIVEVMGHKQFAGRITEQTLAGSALVRVDVPAVITSRGMSNAYSKLVGVGSIYCITPTTEEVATKAARVLAQRGEDPLPVYIPEERQLPAGVTVGPDDEDEDEWPQGHDDDDLPL